jgi:hypothetical protein
MNWLRRQINNPQQRWAEFKLGLVIFAAGALLIILGSHYWIWFQLPGIFCLTIGMVVAAKGYLGMLLFRLTVAIKPHLARKNDSDKDK